MGNIDVILIMLGIIVLIFDVYSVLQLRNKKTYTVLHECGEAKLNICLYKIFECIVADIIGLSISIIILLMLSYKLENDFMDTMLILGIYTAIKYVGIGIISCKQFDE